MQLKDKLKNYAKMKKVDFNIALRFYMYDRFIKRLSISKYNQNFILKGGFYLSSLYGIENRATVDIDTYFTKEEFNLDNVKRMIEEIINTDVNDNITMKITNIGLIRSEDEYGGFRIKILCQIDNVKEIISIDVATGDSIFPKTINYKYKTILDNNYIGVFAYPIETVIAEKLESILSKGEFSSRMKDYYDIYLIYVREFNDINKSNLKRAIKATFTNRKFLTDVNEAFNKINNSEVMKKK